MSKLNDIEKRVVKEAFAKYSEGTTGLVKDLADQTLAKIVNESAPKTRGKKSQGESK
jgi:hypothetical protein